MLTRIRLVHPQRVLRLDSQHGSTGGRGGFLRRWGCSVALDEAGRRLPWFKMWTRDMMADPTVQRLTWEQRGRYVWALMCSWETERPGIAMEDTWAEWMGYKSAEDDAFDEYRSLFKTHPGYGDYVLVQSKLSKEFEISRAERAKHSIAGRSGAEARWRGNAGPLDVHSGANAISEVRSQKSDTQKKKRLRSPDGSLSTEFDQFWEAYPLKVGKKPCLTKWNKHDYGLLIHLILPGVEKWKKSGRWSDPKFIPHPTTFIAQERWNDDPTSKYDREGNIPWEGE